jgi:sigma-B regulation protein RsbU (phosphoserine phosphatase)
MGIGDVTGHGLQAGVIMLMAQTALLTLSQSGEQDMGQILSILNRVLYQNIVRIRENKNMTLSVLRYHNQAFDIVGQHESVLICRKSGQVEVIDTMDLGFPIGLEDNIDDFIFTERFCLEPDDVMLLYTDGVTEAENSQREMFGMTNLTEALTKYHKLEAKDILSRIVDDVYTFIDTAQVYDDISMLVVKQK